MAMWPFGKKKQTEEAEATTRASEPTEDAAAAAPDDGATEPQPTTDEKVAPAAAQDAGPGPVVIEHDAVKGETGPFDGDSVDISQFDFADFSNGILNLGSMQLPLPKASQVQVEMGENGPKMLHIVTEYGRITPVAFAAPKAASQWEESLPELRAQMDKDGLQTHLEAGPWGQEIAGSGANDLAVRMIGVEGPRWLLRFTLMGPKDRAEGLVSLARELAARTFVYRGENPILAGNSLPIALPQPLVEQIQKTMQQRAAQQQATQPQGTTDPAGENLAQN